MPKVYAPVVAKDGEKDKNVTHYLGFVGGGVLFRKDQMVSIKSVTDGTSNTLMIAEAVTGVPWTKPEDLAFTGGSPAQARRPIQGRIRRRHRRRLPAICSRNPDPTLLVEMITRGGGEVIDLSDAGEGIHVP